MKNKKALSSIVATLLIIILTLVAVGIIWVVVKNVVQGEMPQIIITKDDVCHNETSIPKLVENYTIGPNDYVGNIPDSARIINFSNVRGIEDCKIKIDLESAILNSSNFDDLKKKINSTAFKIYKVYFAENKTKIQNDNSCPATIDFYFINLPEIQNVCEPQIVEDSNVICAKETNIINLDTKYKICKYVYELEEDNDIKWIEESCECTNYQCSGRYGNNIEDVKVSQEDYEKYHFNYLIYNNKLVCGSHYSSNDDYYSFSLDKNAKCSQYKCYSADGKRIYNIEVKR